MLPRPSHPIRGRSADGGFREFRIGFRDNHVIGKYVMSGIFELCDFLPPGRPNWRLRIAQELPPSEPLGCCTNRAN
jgi:hypothetical protein